MAQTAENHPHGRGDDPLDPQDDPPTARLAGARMWIRWLIVSGLVVVAGLLCSHYWLAWQAQRSPGRAFERALVALDGNDWEGVQRELRSLETDPQYEPHRHFLRGAISLDRGDLPGALDELAKSRDFGPLRSRTLTLAGQALYQAGNLVAAQQVLMQAVEADPGAVDAHRWLGAIYYDLGAADHAIAALGRVAELAPSDPRPERLMGLMNKDYERFDEAVVNYREALRRIDAGPEDSKSGPDKRPRPLVLPATYREELSLELAECEIKLRQYQTGLATLETCSPSPERQVMRAECYYALGKNQEAQAILDQTLASSSDHLPALILQGTVSLETGDADQALKVFLHAVELQPKDYTARFKLVQAYRKLGRTDDADAQARVADSLKQLRQDFAALHQQAIREPANAEVRFRLGQMAQQLDRPDLAVIWFKATLALDPNHAQALQKLQE